MAEDDKSSSTFKGKVIFPLILAILAGGSSPWWYSKIFPPQNLLPAASARDGQTIQLPQNSVTLDGSGSSDKDGQIVKYLWTKESGPTRGTFIDPNVARSPVTGLAAGTYIFRLTVTDDRGGKATGIVTVTVKAAEQVTSNIERTIEKRFSLIGVWGNTRGDNEMDTNEGDVVPVLCRTELLVSSKEVAIQIKYKIVEDGGDHTTFDDTIVRTVFVAGSNDGAILDVHSTGGLRCEFNETSQGENHMLKPFRTDGTYWEYLKYKVDGSGSDNNVIGIEGKLKITVVMDR